MKEEKILTKKEINKTGDLVSLFGQQMCIFLNDHYSLEIDTTNYNGDYGWDIKKIIERALKRTKETSPPNWDWFYHRFYNDYLKKKT